jgi:nucleoside-diphosphate-sugar epimerase
VRLLVTGATGHVAREVVRQALAAGDEVVAPYRDAPGEDDTPEAPGLTWVRCDLADPAAVARLGDDHAVDACIHGAAISNEAYARPQPLAAIHGNVGASANLLDAARRQSWRRFILISTGSVFQQQSDATRPILEDALPTPVDIYATTKHCAEQLTRMYRTLFELEAATIRISWVYGPPVVSDSPTRGPIPMFLRRALAGIPLREPSGADAAASYTYVGDVAAGLLAACRAPALSHAVYHLGCGVNFTTGEVAEAVKAAVPGAVIELGPGGEPWTTYTAPRGPLAGSRLSDDTGFSLTPSSLAAGVKAYAEWMRANPASYRASPPSNGLLRARPVAGA